MAYTGDDVRKLAEQHLREMRQCDEVRWQMVQDFLARIREMDKKKAQK